MNMLRFLYLFCINVIICSCWESRNACLYVEFFIRFVSFLYLFILHLFILYLFIFHQFLSYSTGISPVFFNLFISLKALQAIGMAMVKLHASAQA